VGAQKKTIKIKAAKKDFIGSSRVKRKQIWCYVFLFRATADTTLDADLFHCL
jgi:hypothetical protein